VVAVAAVLVLLAQPVRTLELPLEVMELHHQ
jgi:hypothetical protein